MNRQMSPELDEWVERYAARLAAEHEAAAATERRTRTDGNAPPFPLTDAEFAWLWPRFQKCRFGGIQAAKRFARTRLERVTLRGKRFALRMAFRHRTQILGKSARQIGHDEFLSAIRTAAARSKL